jgi:hypothetical protein
MTVKLNRFIAILVLLALTISFSGCFLFGGGNDALPEWRTAPTAIINSEMALTHVAELFELPENLLLVDPEAGEIVAVTAESSRITGFKVTLTEQVWDEDVAFFIVTRDYRVYFNLSGEEVRDGVYLISRYDEDALTGFELPLPVVSAPGTATLPEISLPDVLDVLDGFDVLESFGLHELLGGLEGLDIAALLALLSELGVFDVLDSVDLHQVLETQGVCECGLAFPAAPVTPAETTPPPPQAEAPAAITSPPIAETPPPVETLRISSSREALALLMRVTNIPEDSLQNAFLLGISAEDILNSEYTTVDGRTVTGYSFVVRGTFYSEPVIGFLVAEDGRIFYRLETDRTTIHEY